MAPCTEPTLVGVSETLMPHLALDLSTRPATQGALAEGPTLKSPDPVTLDRVSEPAVEFWITALPVYVSPIATLPKLSEVGENANGLVAGPPVASPLKVTDCGLKRTLPEVSLTAKAPRTVPPVPFVVGLNVTLNVHDAAAASTLPQGAVPLATAAKSPPTLQPIFCAALALFVTVTV